MAKNKRIHPPAAVPALAAAPSFSFLARMLAWGSLAWAAWIIWTYWNRFTWLTNFPPAPTLTAGPTHWGVFLEDAKALALLATLTLGMSAWGSTLLRFFRLTWKSALEEFIFSMGLGFSATGYLILGLGLLQLYKTPVFWGLWAAGLILAWRRWFRGSPVSWLQAAALRINQWHSKHAGWWFQWMLLWIVIGGSCVMAFVPEIFYDSMVYHLGVPKWYLFEGGIKYYPSVTAQFPFLRQMLNLFGLALEGERLAKLLHWSSAPLIIATYQVLSSRYSFPKTTLIAGLALFTMPMVAMNLWTTGVDIGLASYAMLAFLAWVNGWSEPETRGRWFTLAGVFGGFCFSSKYPGLIVVVMMCVTTFIWLALVEKNALTAVRESARLGLVALAVSAPWLIKTWLMTGNPVYPYLFNVFGGRDLLLSRVELFKADTGGGAKTHLIDLLKTPWSETFAEISSLSALGVFLLGFLGFLFTGVFRKDLRRPWYVIGVIFFVLYWFCINAMTDRLRLGIAGLAIGCFLMAHTAAHLYDQGNGFFRFLLAGVVAFSALLGVMSTYPTLYYSYYPWDVLAGRETAVDYLSYTHSGMDPYPSTRLFMYAKEIMPPGQRLLIVGDEEVSPAPVPFLATGAFNDSLVVQWAKEAKTVDDLVQRFKQERVSHVLLNPIEALRLNGYKILYWDTRSLGLFCEFFEKHLPLLRREDVHERFGQQTFPLVLYQFVEKPTSQPPAQNIFLELYEQSQASSKDPMAISKWRQALEELDKAHPGLATVKQRLDYWRSQERMAHAPAR